MRQENWSVRKLRKLLDNKIAAVENVMREGLESASTDYCRFFEWKAAYLYKGELLRGHYRLLRNKVSRTDDVEDLKRYFGDIAMYHRERLAGGTPAGSGTHPMADTCRALSLECSRQVLKDCMEFSRILSLEQPEEDVKKENLSLIHSDAADDTPCTPLPRVTRKRRGNPHRLLPPCSGSFRPGVPFSHSAGP